MSNFQSTCPNKSPDSDGLWIRQLFMACFGGGCFYRWHNSKHWFLVVSTRRILNIVLLQLCGGIIFDRVILTQVMPSGKGMRFMKSSLIVITLALTLKTLQVSLKHMSKWPNSASPNRSPLENHQLPVGREAHVATLMPFRRHRRRQCR